MSEPGAELPPEVPPEVLALQRAMPYTRLIDCGMAAADARDLLAATSSGQDWITVCGDIAVRRAEAARAAADLGRSATARLQQRWAVGAALFAQMAENTDTDAKRNLYAAYVSQVQAMADLLDPGLERLEVGHRDGRLVGWLRLPPSGRAAATVVVWGGLSGWGAAYLDLADALVERGIACLLAEGPGQGEPRLRDHLYVDADVAAGFGRFVDAVMADPRLGEAVGIQGNSFGGLFAAHLAAADERVGACVVNGAPSAPQVPPFRTARAQIVAAFGTEDDVALQAVLDDLRFDPERQPISGAVLVLHGGADPLVGEVSVQAPFAAAAGERGELRTWPDGEHTIYNHGPERDAVVADWFVERLLTGDP